MSYHNLLLDIREHVAIVTINRPKALNALNTETVEELLDVFYKLGQDPKIRVIILTGSGEKAFVAGADIAEMSTMSPVEARRFSKMGHQLMNLIENTPQPVIAAINGYALGGGNEIAMACDIRLASETAKFGQPEVNLGLMAGFGGTQRLTRLVGSGRACEILLSGEMIDAEEAYRIGLVNHLYPPAELMPAALALAQTIARRAPLAVQRTKSAVYRGQDMDLNNAQAYEAEVFAQLFSTKDQKEGCAAFLEKRKPLFTGE